MTEQTNLGRSRFSETNFTPICSTLVNNSIIDRKRLFFVKIKMVRAYFFTSILLLGVLVFALAYPEINSNRESRRGPYRGYGMDSYEPDEEDRSLVSAPIQTNYRSDGYREYSRHPNGSGPGEQPIINPLLRQTTTSFICVIFGLYIWRAVAVYEMADQITGAARLAVVTPTIFILLANIVGFVLNIMQPLNFKSQLKVILLLNILRETCEMVFNVYKLISTKLGSSVPREEFMGRFFMNIWWFILCYSASKARWVSHPPQRPQQQFQYRDAPYDTRRPSNDRAYF